MTTHLPRALRTAATAAVLGLTLSSTASAAPQTYLSLEDLALRSDGCALARVVDARVHWNEARTLIVTTYTLDVEESLAGGLPTGPVLLHRVGGELDGMALGYHGMPELEVGDHSVVFVHARPGGSYIVSGMQQGVIPEVDGRFSRDLREVLAAPAPREDLPLEELRARVRTAAERQR
jgi:hypothetical protein